MRKKAVFKSNNNAALGEMEFDPVLGVWVGNDEIMKSFHQPGLIVNKGQPNKAKNFAGTGMQWDPKEGKWIGNETDLKIFGATKKPALISKLNDANIKTESMLFLCYIQ